VVALLDVNVLIALFDPSHVHHEAAHKWFEINRKYRWATCPLTENPFVRLLSNPSYRGQTTTLEDAASRLRAFRSESEHVFWPDSVSICERGRNRASDGLQAHSARNSACKPESQRARATRSPARAIGPPTNMLPGFRRVISPCIPAHRSGFGIPGQSVPVAIKAPARSGCDSANTGGLVRRPLARPSMI
jgi:toxin-antitoxin system PIN domain toxin